MAADNRRVRMVALVQENVKHLLLQILREGIAEHYSEATMKEMCDTLTAQLAVFLCRNPDFDDILTEGDILSVGGKLNADGILRATEVIADRQERPDRKAMLLALSQHMRHVFTESKLTKGVQV